ncbi:unannotated protein [freshwater metagenome]|uniref:Unannotated protein n=1 Tax=freshwater metagenome TaxID=449393 RepID=A0A6J6ZUM1_9ZZZZ|nr:hypothetical protein [Actinomycetota bacterium]
MKKFLTYFLSFNLILTTVVATAPTSFASAKNSLKVTYQETPESKIQKWTLKCQPTSGTMKNSKPACRNLLKISNPFAKADPNQMCSEIYESAEVATVKGTWNGKKVSARFAKTNSCEITRWNALKFLIQGVQKA